MTQNLSTEQKIQILWDRQEIQETKLRFGRALDTHEWELYRTCFTDPFEVDFSDLTGRAPTTVDARTWCDLAAAILGPCKVHHQYSNHQIKVDGDEAEGLHYMVARHRRFTDNGDSENYQYGWYENRYKRTGDGWKISKLKHCMHWVVGNAAVLDAGDPDVAATLEKIFG